MTARQAVVRQPYVELSGRPEYDVVTGKGGQCFLNADRSWKQAPRGACPVVMKYQGHSND